MVRVKCPIIIPKTLRLSASWPGVYSGVVTFEFFRLRFHFEAVDSLGFPPGSASQTLRGAFGYALREIACRCGMERHCQDCAYARIFEPRHAATTGPSGFGELPRPFVLRTRHLDEQVFAAGQPFWFDIHLFDLRHPSIEYFVPAFALLADHGIRGRRAQLISTEQLDTNGRIASVVWDGKQCSNLSAPASVPLAAEKPDGDTVSVRFLTPTELKCDGGLATRPEFSVLFARIRDRISLLRTLYGSGPLEIDFHAAGERAAGIEMTRCE